MNKTKGTFKLRNFPCVLNFYKFKYSLNKRHVYSQCNNLRIGTRTTRIYDTQVYYHIHWPNGVVIRFLECSINSVYV